MVRKFHEYTHQRSVPPPLRAVLGRLGALYALWSLSQHTALLYQGEAPVVGTCLPALSRPSRAGVQPHPIRRLGLLVRHYLHVHSLSGSHGLGICGQMRSPDSTVRKAASGQDVSLLSRVLFGSLFPVQFREYFQEVHISQSGSWSIVS